MTADLFARLAEDKFENGYSKVTEVEYDFCGHIASENIKNFYA
jgi:hypothetical protein